MHSSCTAHLVHRRSICVCLEEYLVLKGQYTHADNKELYNLCSKISKLSCLFEWQIRHRLCTGMNTGIAGENTIDVLPDLHEFQLEMENIFISSKNNNSYHNVVFISTWISRKPKALPITVAVKSLPPLPKVVISPVLHPCRWKLNLYILVKKIELFLKLLSQ